MARRPRTALGGLAYHVMNRAAGQQELFEHAGDYLAFEQVLGEARERVGMRVCAYALLPNHFHLVLWPRGDGDLSRFMQWLTMTHTQRWHAFRRNLGHGHLYQSRFKSFPIQTDEHFLRVCRYVERNALRARLAKRAEDWEWGSLACRESKLDKRATLLDEWPVERPRGWCRAVNRPQDEQELEWLRQCVQRGRPYGDAAWIRRTAIRLGLESSLRPVGRPKKAAETKTNGF
jgi:putative transposase